MRFPVVGSPYASLIRRSRLVGVGACGRCSRMDSPGPSQTFKPVLTWTVDDVCSWIKGLDSSLQVHTPQFLAHCICGEDLVKLDRQKLEYLKVTQIGHQELLMEAVELLVALDNSVHQQTVVRKARVLSKKASQLVQLTSKPYPESKTYSQSLERAASVMEAARSIISWLNDNPCALVADYETFRESALKASLNINSAVAKEPDHCREVLHDSGKAMVKLTSELITPQHFNAGTDSVIVDVTLKPDKDGLGFSLCKHIQGPLQVNHVEPGGSADQSGQLFVGDEVLQVNRQNVVGWEVPNVVTCLKLNPYQVLLTIKSNMSRTPPTNRRRSSNSKDEGRSSQSLSPSAQTRHKVMSNSSYRHSSPVHFVLTKDEPTASKMSNGHLPLRNAVSAPPKQAAPSKKTSVRSASVKDGCRVEEQTDGASTTAVTDGAAQRKKMRNGSSSVDAGVLGNPSPVSLTSQSSEELSVFTGQADSEYSSRTNTPDEDASRATSREERAASVPPKGHSATATKKKPSHNVVSASNVAMTLLGSNKMQSSSTGDLPSTCYRTQIIGGVVHKIPITPQATPPASPPESRKTASEQVFKTVVVGGVVMKIPVEKAGKVSEDTKQIGASARRKSSKKKKDLVQKEPVPKEESPSPVKFPDREDKDTSPNPEDEVSAHKGVFSNPKDVTISGHSTKEVEVQSQLESISSKRPDKKHDTPELMVPCFQLKGIDHEGWLQKLGGSGLTPKNWRKRWFVLKGPHLYYYKTAFDVCALGLVKLSGYTVEETADSKKQFAFHLSKEGERTYYFISDTPEEMTKWMHVLKKASEL